MGSHWRHEDFDDASLVDIVGTVVESSPPRRLVLTWSFLRTPGIRKRSPELPLTSRPGDAVRLTVTHSELEPDSPMLHGISRGWPLVLSSLKTMLETGEPLPGTKRTTRPPD